MSVASFIVMHQRSGTIVSTSDDLISTSEELIRTLKTVGDPATASAATPKLKEQYEKVIDLSKDLISTAKSADRFGGVTKEGKEKLIDRMQKFGRILQQLGSEVERIRGVQGLPRDFWVVVRTNMIKTSLVWLEVASSQLPAKSLEVLRCMGEMIEEFGAEHIAVVDISELPGTPAAEVEAKLKAKLGPNAKTLINAIDNDTTIVVGPVDDFEKFAASIDFGTVILKDPGQLLVAVGRVGAAPIGAQASVDDPAAPATPGLQEPRPQFGPPTNDTDASSPAGANPSEPIDPVAAARMRAEIEQKRMEDQGFPDRSDPEYHKKLCDLMVDSKKWSLNDEAIDAILKIQPQDIQDKAVRQQIARNFRELAQKSSSGNDQGKAIRGLAMYGGKYSVPVLIEILEDQSLRAPDELFEALASFPDAKGAEAVSQQLGNFFNHRKAVRTLRAMGEVAEDALLKVAPSDNSDVSLAAVQLLGEVGTKKSLPLLAKAGKSKNVDVKTAAKDATKAILDRSKAATP